MGDLRVAAGEPDVSLFVCIYPVKSIDGGAEGAASRLVRAAAAGGAEKSQHQ
jgi:hypothetical protein